MTRGSRAMPTSLGYAAARPAAFGSAAGAAAAATSQAPNTQSGRRNRSNFVMTNVDSRVGSIVSRDRRAGPLLLVPFPLEEPLVALVVPDWRRWLPLLAQRVH